MSRPLRVAQIVSSYYPGIGGVETHVRRLAEGLAASGHQITVLTHKLDGSPADEQVGPVRVLRFPLAVRSRNYPWAPGMFSYMRGRAAEFDIVHAHSYHTLVGHAAVRTGLPFIFTSHYHGTGHTRFRAALHGIYRLAGARIIKAADAVICVSDSERRLIIGDFPAAAKKAVVIPSGTDRRRRVPLESRSPQDAPIVLTIGRLERYKNVDLVIDAFRASACAATLVVVGDGPDRLRLEKHVQSTEPGWPVVFTGRISDAELDGWLARAHVVTSASDHEAYGLTLADGLAYGARVVASAIPAHADVARQAGTDAAIALVDPKDTAGFADALTESVLAGPVAAENLKLPSWEEAVEETCKLYARVYALRAMPSGGHPSCTSTPSARSPSPGHAERMLP